MFREKANIAREQNLQESKQYSHCIILEHILTYYGILSYTILYYSKCLTYHRPPEVPPHWIDEGCRSPRLDQMRCVTRGPGTRSGHMKTEGSETVRMRTRSIVSMVMMLAAVTMEYDSAVVLSELWAWD